MSAYVKARSHQHRGYRLGAVLYVWVEMKRSDRSMIPALWFRDCFDQHWSINLTFLSQGGVHCSKLWSESVEWVYGEYQFEKKKQNYLRLIPNLNSVGENSKQALLMCLFSNTKVTETQIIGEMGWWRYRQVLSFLRCPYPHWGRKWGHPIYLHLLISWKGEDNNHASDLKKENN